MTVGGVRGSGGTAGVGTDGRAGRDDGAGGSASFEQVVLAERAVEKVLRGLDAPEDPIVHRMALLEVAGKLPHLAGTDLAELLYHDDAEASFELGLDWLLAGAAASLAGGRLGPAP